MEDTVPVAWRTVFRPDGGHFWSWMERKGVRHDFGTLSAFGSAWTTYPHRLSPQLRLPIGTPIIHLVPPSQPLQKATSTGRCAPDSAGSGVQRDARIRPAPAWAPEPASTLLGPDTPDHAPEMLVFEALGLALHGSPPT